MKHEIYAAAFDSYLFYDLFLQGGGGGVYPLDPLLFFCPKILEILITQYTEDNFSKQNQIELSPVEDSL